MAGEINFIGTMRVFHSDGDIVLPCQSIEGGGKDPELGTSTDPYSGKTKSRGGLSKTENLTVEIEVDLTVWNLKARLDDSAGKHRYQATMQMVDDTRAVIGDPASYTGVFGKPKWPKGDVNGGDNTAMLEVECGVDG